MAGLLVVVEKNVLKRPAWIETVDGWVLRRRVLGRAVDLAENVVGDVVVVEPIEQRSFSRLTDGDDPAPRDRAGVAAVAGDRPRSLVEVAGPPVGRPDVPLRRVDGVGVVVVAEREGVANNETEVDGPAIGCAVDGAVIVECLRHGRNSYQAQSEQ